MRDVGILEGDLLAVHRTDRVRDGQIVVAAPHQTPRCHQRRLGDLLVSPLGSPPDGGGAG